MITTGWRFAVIGLFAIVWEIAGRAAGSLLLPTASDTARALVALLQTAQFWRAFWLSNESLVVGFPVALVAGVVAGLALGRWRALDQALTVYLRMLLATPMAAVMPLIVMSLGLGLISRAAVVFAFSFPIVAATVRAGVREVDQQLLSMARTFAATEIQTWRTVVLPGALPAVMTAARLGLARSVAGMISVELLLVAVGIGRLILVFRSDFDAASVYAAVVVVIAEAVVLIQMMAALERRLGRRMGAP